jgi:hypothetical protein
MEDQRLAFELALAELQLRFEEPDGPVGFGQIEFQTPL